MTRTCEVETRIGTLRCETHESEGIAYNGLTIYWNGRQLAVVEQAQDTPAMRVLVWDHLTDYPYETFPTIVSAGPPEPEE